MSFPAWRSEIFRWPAPAKINLFLHITGRRNDGYHLLQTVFQFLDLQDEIQIAIRNDGEIIRKNDLTDVPHERDLVVRAARLLQDVSGSARGAEITVHKNLPMGGGLGGGSSDAATTLVALNKLWDLNFSRANLCQIGIKLGADVPIFIHGHAAWAEGIGDQLENIEPSQSYYLLVIPPVSVNTRQIFSSPELTRDCQPITIRDFLAGAPTANVCESVARHLYPEIGAVLDWLSERAPTRMTGTGACIFAAFEAHELALVAQNQLPKEWQSVVCRGLNHSPLYLALNEAAEGPR